MSHFTYSDNIDTASLKQGDVLKKSELLTSIISTVHPYFNSLNYQYFIILTQSCDLVKRTGSKCKSKYITIAAIRSLSDALIREAEDIATTKIERKVTQLIDEKNSTKISEFLVRLFNNNIPDYFYLHHDVSLDFVEPSVAFLRVSIALKSDLHYDDLLKCKVLELDENFQAKLGWLVGNLYSRVGTVDWVPNNIDQPAFNKMVNNQIKAFFQVLPNLSEIQKLLEKDHSSEAIEAMSNEELLKIIRNVKVPNRKEKILLRLEALITESMALKDGYNLQKLLSKINSDPTFTSLTK